MLIVLLCIIVALLLWIGMILLRINQFLAVLHISAVGMYDPKVALRMAKGTELSSALIAVLTRKAREQG